jgi:hypothetical protein
MFMVHFPTDAYSHTPANAGAKQPGLTGQVKEDILSRFNEIGIQVKEGKICFKPTMFHSGELVSEATSFRYYDINGEVQEIFLDRGQFAFTFLPGSNSF